MLGKCSRRNRAPLCVMSRKTQSRPWLLHLVVDGAGDDVARRQFGARIVLGHEARAVGQAQDAAFAAHRLGDQERLGVRVIEAGRMELDELHVGDAAAGAPGHGDAVAGRGVGIGGVEVDLAGAAGGEHGMAGAEGDHPVAVAVEHIGAEAAVCARRPSLAPVMRSMAMWCSSTLMFGWRATCPVRVPAPPRRWRRPRG